MGYKRPCICGAFSEEKRGGDRDMIDLRKNFSQAARLPEDFACFDFTKDEPEMMELEELFGKTMIKKLLKMSAHGAFQFSVCSNLENVEDAIKEAALKRIRETGTECGLSSEELGKFSVECRKHDWVGYFYDGQNIAEKYAGTITVNDRYMEHGFYPVIPYAGKPEGVSSDFIGEKDGYLYSRRNFEDLRKVEETLRARRRVDLTEREDAHMKSTYTEHMPLQLTKETILRRTEYKKELSPAERMQRMEQGRSPVPVYATEEELDLSCRFQRMGLLRAVIKDMMKGQLGSDPLKDVQAVLTAEIAEIVKEFDDELPFH